ncbi:FIG00657500: hypothetical protein [hydrothermal vent metagenome]|uniref:DUF4381 domain-containing protein n=1 Tax=hydrothermal vent metagenome TaxID=652676 RepID=A0A3B0ZBV3_9ZZZZ
MEETLENLRDITLPAAVSWWPPAPGWWLLAVLLIIVIAFCINELKKRYLRISILLLAQKERDKIVASYNKNKDSTVLMSQLSILLKRYALLCFPEKNVAGLNGEPWQKFIMDQGPDTVNSRKISKLFTTSPYKKVEAIDTEIIITYFNHWLEHTHTNSQYKFLHHKR